MKGKAGARRAKRRTIESLPVKMAKLISEFYSASMGTLRMVGGLDIDQTGFPNRRRPRPPGNSSSHRSRRGKNHQNR